ncbi:integral membrane protein [Colletotrichum scovillei]|uniref:Integral membrane protein n=1 Tax=Colletotrichum scovillei TaxID=1209932 RepID=A0A9P7R3M3_9PEZI|nr:integral membrane protein [Colletotrichum scovillei]KAG7059556.1 integral membrane protein [Colletotrichum scovillei]
MRDIELQADLSSCVRLKCSFEDQKRAAQVETDLCATFPKPSRREEARAVALSLSIIAFTVVGLRCISRYLVDHRLWWDDWMIIAATILLAAITGIQIAGTGLGFGLHYWHVEPWASTRLIQMFYIGEQLYILAQIMAKISLLLFFSRIFFSSRWFYLTTQLFILFLILHAAIFLFLVIFECTPVTSTWNLDDPSRKCMNIVAIGYSGAVFSVIEDIAILLLPIPELLRLQLSTKKKLWLSLIFGLGSFGCVTSMVRLKFLVHLSFTSDVTWDNVDVINWSLVEVSCAILCASLPALRPLLRFLVSRKPKKTTDATPFEEYQPTYRRDKFSKISDDPSTELSLSPVDTGLDDIAREFEMWNRGSSSKGSTHSVTTDRSVSPTSQARP